MFNRPIHLVFLILCVISALTTLKLCADDITYEVQFEGIDDQNIITTLKSVSELIILQKSPPATGTALRRRAEADISNMVRGLHSFAYYNAKISLDIDLEISPAQIIVNVDLGPIYPIAGFNIIPVPSDDEEDCNEEFEFEAIKLKTLGLTIGCPALPKTILEAENILLSTMAKKGYPLGSIEKREVFANQETKCIEVTLHVNSGPRAYFGETSIKGLCDVKESVIRKKISWCEWAIFDPAEIERTLCDIESSGLFSAVTITPADEATEEGLIPIEIEVIEGMQKTIGGGVGYNTEVGPGVIAIWENRNIRGIGEKLTFKADVAQYQQTGTLIYAQPDFLSPKQDLLWITEVESENTRGFSDTAFSFSGILDRELSLRSKFSYGGTIKQLHTEHSNNNRQFVLLKAPMQYRWSSANCLLNPTKGKSLVIRVTPTAQVVSPTCTYCFNTITGTIYRSLTKDRKIVIAAKASLGSIWGASDISIPPPERFYLGSDNTLRGYNYLTVSPLNERKKPIGGRSMMVYSLETRFRVTEEIGVVGFYEIGNAYLDVVPQFLKKQRQCVGLGLRYHTAVGPLRFDIAMPLNPRSFDRRYQLYFNIGQAF